LLKSKAQLDFALRPDVVLVLIEAVKEQQREIRELQALLGGLGAGLALARLLYLRRRSPRPA
jgi:hypothetical protein